ncbi:UNVERIFIED_ORG: 3-methyl-2-oxobutanoate hydroxymethyltransferase domain protein [Clostridioides difficile Y384]
MKDSIKNYILEVETGAFPQEKHSFSIKESELEKLYED